MFLRRLPQAACVLSACVCLILAYEDDVEVNYADNYNYNEIPDVENPEPTPSQAPCVSRDLTRWDKLFSMLENSQMRENMLLQYADDIIKVEMASLRAEILRFVVQFGGSCGAAMETAGRRMASLLEGRLKETMERLKPRDSASAAAAAAAGNPVRGFNQLEAKLQQLLAAAQAQTSRLTKLENSCLSRTAAGMGLNTKPGAKLPEEQEVTPQEAALDGVLAAMQKTRVELEEVLRSSMQRLLPAGCETALLFPMRSRRIYASVIPDAPLSLSSFTVCMWVKPTAASNRTVLFSYGNRRNPFEIQLLLGHTSAHFTVGGEAHLVEAPGVVAASPGGAPEWVHLCGAWSSRQGLASVWAAGKKVASSPGVAEGHVLPDGGSLQLGQERGGGVTGLEGGFDPKMAFAGKMTGVNMWDRALSEEEISQLALREGHGSNPRGNVVAWGVTEMVPHGGAQFIN
ncbi:pentraxin-related protein PTX3 [Pungitius pungitius]|uniref:pentraxin-related protein PTX3 n=1 Tax=Pungitius pungitius TaxID=134920 RepID=UPI002E11FB7A